MLDAEVVGSLYINSDVLMIFWLFVKKVTFHFPNSMIKQEHADIRRQERE